MPQVKRKTYHERGQGSRLYPSINMIQNPSLLLLNFDIVNDILPRENSRLLLDDTSICSVCPCNFLLYIISSSELASFWVIRIV